MISRNTIRHVPVTWHDIYKVGFSSVTSFLSNVHKMPKQAATRGFLTGSMSVTKPTAVQEVHAATERLNQLISEFHSRDSTFLSSNISAVTPEINQGIVSGRRKFTNAAKAVVETLLASKNRSDVLEHSYPSFMLPSAKEDDYSLVSDYFLYSSPNGHSHSSSNQWCSLCNDRDSPILLCAGCRIGICYITGTPSHSGCMKWNHTFDAPDLVFYCPFCCKTGNRPFKVSLDSRL